MAQKHVTAPGTLFLDSEGISKAAVGDVGVRAFLQAAERRGARVVVSALSLTETLGGGPRDAKVRRVIKAVDVVPVTEESAKEAGRLLGTVATRNDATVDANIAVAAMVQPRPLMLLTSDPVDMTALTAAHPHIVITHI
ncbi:type II toxin-antitoxin system VapC family toxin [Modestobacter lapidis]|nr:type II toxin-antitoxin system VapC family toxin [Modestobacter lapidis]